MPPPHGHAVAALTNGGVIDDEPSSASRALRAAASIEGLPRLSIDGWAVSVRTSSDRGRGSSATITPSISSPLQGRDASHPAAAGVSCVVADVVPGGGAGGSGGGSAPALLQQQLLYCTPQRLTFLELASQVRKQPVAGSRETASPSPPPPAPSADGRRGGAAAMAPAPPPRPRAR